MGAPPKKTMKPIGWIESEEGLSRTFVLEDFRQAVGFVVEVAKLAERLQHHPDINIRWNRVVLQSITHDAGHQITEKDYELARQINKLSSEHTSQ